MDPLLRSVFFKDLPLIVTYNCLVTFLRMSSLVKWSHFFLSTETDKIMWLILYKNNISVSYDPRSVEFTRRTGRRTQWNPLTIDRSPAGEMESGVQGRTLTQKMCFISLIYKLLHTALLAKCIWGWTLNSLAWISNRSVVIVVLNWTLLPQKTGY